MILQQRNMSQLSKYIQKQLASILNKIHETPPKKSASMKKIKTLVNQAPLTLQQKAHLNKSIQRIQSAMAETRVLNKKTSHSQYAKNLFYQNMFLQQKNMNRQAKKHNANNCSEPQSSHEYHRLLEKLQQVRSTRMKRQKYLQQLIIKSQRMERMVQLRQQNQDKYLKSKMIQEYLQNKKSTEEEAKKQLKEVIKNKSSSHFSQGSNNSIKSIRKIVTKYNNLLQT